jgi:hypothetical protein
MQRYVTCIRNLAKSTAVTGVILIAGSAIWTGAAQAQACPNAGANGSAITLGAQQLGQSTREFAARYAAGPLNRDTCPDVIRRGYFNEVPSLNLALTGTRPGGSVSLNLRTNDDDCDPVVIVNTPDGEWFEDDDSGSSIGRHWDALIDVPTTRDGVYRVWLGHYREGETCEGTLRIGYDHGDGTMVPTTTSFAEWFSITNNQGQFIAQPGGVTPIPVNPGPYFEAGTYDVYLADALNNGLGPMRNIVRYTVTFQSNQRYAADIGQTSFGVTTASNMYRDPGVGFASLYVRNSNQQRWRAICVLPQGSDISQCGGGGQTVYSEWTTISRDQRQFSTQPGGVFPMATCDRSTRQGAGDYPEGTYDIYVGNAGDNGFQPFTDLRLFTVTLSSGQNYAVDLGCSTGFCISSGGAQLMQYSRPSEGYARIYARNSSIMNWRAMCVLPAGWDRVWCEIGNPYPCAGPGDQH